MSEFALARSLSDGARQANEYHCYCMDCDDGDNDINDVSKFVRLGCRCVLHYHCLVKYVRSRLRDRLTMSLNGISCPYGSDCQSFKTLHEVGGDDTKIYYITTADLDTIVDYGMSHPKLQQYLDEHECEALTHEEVSGLREWIEQQVNTPHRKFTDEDYDLFIISTTKACPSCGYRSTHYHGHQCHHISPARPPQRGGCPNCHVNYCYKCLSTEVENRRDRGSDANCRCGYWSNFCHPIKSSSDIKSYIATNEGGIPYDTRCGCVICSDCRYGSPCDYCSGDCCVCRGHVNPSPNECIDAKNEAKKWIADGPSLSNKGAAKDSLWDYCRQGDVEALAQLLQSTAVTTQELNRQDRDGRTALYLACDANHSECVRLLLSHVGIDADTANRYGKTPLNTACDRGHTDIVRLLLSHDGINVNIANRYGETPLHAACDRRHIDIVRMLLSHNGTNVNIANSSGDTPLYVAYCRGGGDTVRLLLAHDSINTSRDTSLWGCCRYGDADALRPLLESGAITVEEVNRQDGDGRTALYLACDAGHSECTRLLLSHDGIDVNIANSCEQTPLYTACWEGHTDIVRLLLSHDGTDANIDNRDGQTPLFTACERGHIDIVRLLLSHDGIDVNMANSDGWTPLYTACDSDHSDIVRLLLGHPEILVNSAARNFNRACDRACLSGNERIVTMLLNHPDTDPWRTSFYNTTCLHAACQSGSLGIVRQLLQHRTCTLEKVKIRSSDFDAKDALREAYDREHDDIVLILLEFPGIDTSTFLVNVCERSRRLTIPATILALIDINRPMDSSNLTPLTHACTYNKVQVVEKLLSIENINVNCVCGNETPLIVAARRGLVSIVQLLLNHPEIDPNYVSKSGLLPLLSCIRSRSTHVSFATVSELLLNHPRIESSVHLAMETACHKGFTDVVRLLIEYPTTNVNGVDKNGTSYLHSACFFGHTEIVELLLQHDAINVFIKTINGTTPLDFAVKKGHNEIVDMLVHHPQFDPSTMFIPSR